MRCDGDDESVGAGHVARCLPVAQALAQRGWVPTFVGRYTGLAAWLIDRAGVRVEACSDAAPCGVDRHRWTAAIVDTYHAPIPEICALATELAVTTVAEARRCPNAGVVLDYHLDRAGEPVTERELPGPGFAPLDPALVRARHPRPDVGTVLIAVGGGAAGRPLAVGIADEVKLAFPAARIIAGSGVSIDGVDELPFPSSIHDAIAECDIAVSAAGFTAYELACAGVPAVLLEIAPNQRRVARASAAAGTALTLEKHAAWRPTLARALGQLADRTMRTALTAAGVSAFDGLGAARAAAELERRWRGDTPATLLLRAAGHSDSAWLLALRNDPAARTWSFSPTRVSVDEHAGWLERTLADPRRILLIVERDGDQLGQVRLDVDGPTAAVSITVAASARRRGVGRAALRETTRLAAQLGIERLEAHIMSGNAASLQAFAAAGFTGSPCASPGDKLVVTWASRGTSA